MCFCALEKFITQCQVNLLNQILNFLIKNWRVILKFVWKIGTFAETWIDSCTKGQICNCQGRLVALFNSINLRFEISEFLEQMFYIFAMFLLLNKSNNLVEHMTLLYSANSKAMKFLDLSLIEIPIFKWLNLVPAERNCTIWGHLLKKLLISLSCLTVLLGPITAFK